MKTFSVCAITFLVIVLGVGCAVAPTLVPTATPLPPTSTQVPPTQMPLPPTATATATLPPTQTPAPTETSTPVPDTTVVFSDNFDSACNLFVSDNADRTLGCENGEYVMLNKTRNTVWWAYYSDVYDDAVIQVDARAIAGGDYLDYGVVFRLAGDSKSFYRFTISPRGEYSLMYYANEKWTNLLPYTASSAIKPKDTFNRIKIIAQGNQMAVFVNDQFLNTVTDPALASGRVGFIIDNGESNGKVAFDNLTISKINRQLALPQALPTATPEYPPISPGLGGIIVDNYCGFEVYIDIAAKRYTIPVKGRIYIYLPPGHYSVSATAGGNRLACGGGGCSLDVKEGIYTPYPYCGR